MSDLLKRDKLPSFLKLPYQFDLSKIIQALKDAPDQFDDLEDHSSYSKVAETCHSLEETFGLKFSSIEDAYEYLRKNNVKPENMNWDYRDFVKSDGDSFRITDNPYKQLALTEYDPNFSRDEFETKIPSSRLDERQYRKIKDWVRGTYLEEVINTFKGNVTRVRVARMEPGSVIGEHIDYNTDYSIRVHIPITTNEDCGFYVKRSRKAEKEFLAMPASGECWFLNQGFLHSAWNKGNEPRDHLVLSISGQVDLDID